MNKITLAILGAPGSGKGTQAKMLARKLKLQYISTGNIIRNLVKTDHKARRLYQLGLIQPDDRMKKILASVLKSLPSKRIILDTFPLTLGQIKILDELSAEFDLADARIIYLKTDAERVFERIMARKEKRSDDNPQAARRRIKEYQKTLRPVLDYYQKNGRLIEIDGNPAISQVSQALLQKVKI